MQQNAVTVELWKPNPAGNLVHCWPEQTRHGKGFRFQTTKNHLPTVPHTFWLAGAFKHATDNQEKINFQTWLWLPFLNCQRQTKSKKWLVACSIALLSMSTTGPFEGQFNGFCSARQPVSGSIKSCHGQTHSSASVWVAGKVKHGQTQSFTHVWLGRVKVPKRLNRGFNGTITGNELPVCKSTCTKNTINFPDPCQRIFSNQLHSSDRLHGASQTTSACSQRGSLSNWPRKVAPTEPALNTGGAARI